MNHRQVISVSVVAALPAAALLVFGVMNAWNNGGEMSGVMGVILAFCIFLALMVAILPFLMMAWPDFFSPPRSEVAPVPEAEPVSDDDELDADGFDDEVDDVDGEYDDEFEDDDSFSEDDEYDEYEDFEDEDEWK